MMLRTGLILTLLRWRQSLYSRIFDSSITTLAALKEFTDLRLTIRCARSYPRHACPLYVAVFMRLQEPFQAAPMLASIAETQLHLFMRFHAA
jgi:hypothetical protein